MSRHVSYTGVKLSEMNFGSYAPDALKGYWAKKWDEHVRLTVVKSHGLITSDIATEDVSVYLELPQHHPFYLQVLSANGTRNILINDHILINLTAGEQLSGIFTTEV